MPFWNACFWSTLDWKLQTPCLTASVDHHLSSSLLQFVFLLPAVSDWSVSHPLCSITRWQNLGDLWCGWDFCLQCCVCEVVPMMVWIEFAVILICAVNVRRFFWPVTLGLAFALAGSVLSICDWLLFTANRWTSRLSNTLNAKTIWTALNSQH